MTAEETLLMRRFEELAKRADNRGIYTYTDFLGLNEQTLFAAAKKSYGGVPCALFGGAENCERVVARFGDAAANGYEEPWPVSILRIRPRGVKFTETPGHRDYLGALMSLGLGREKLGDVLLAEGEAYLFCLTSVASFIASELTSVRRCPVETQICDRLPETAEQTPREETVTVASLRLDSILAKVLHLSREESAELFSAKRVFVNGALCEKESFAPGEGDRISVRGAGRIQYAGELGKSKKGRLNLKILRYGAS